MMMLLQRVLRLQPAKQGSEAGLGMAVSGHAGPGTQ